MTEIDDQIRRSLGQRLRELPRWKKMLLTFAVVFMGVGLALQASAGGKSVEPSSSTGVNTSGSGATPNSFMGDGQIPGFPLPGMEGSSDGTSTGQTSAADAPSPWGNFFAKGGFSFFIAFCVGAALRAFFKMAVVITGIVALGFFGLSYFNVFDLDWTAMQAHWDTFSAHAMESTKKLRTFVSGQLPSAGFASVGLFAGFKKS